MDRQRICYIDHLRVLLASLVILHHTAIMYSGSGSWFYTEGPVDELSFGVLTLFTATNQTFFMGMFFLFVGFFAARSLDRAGTWRFLRRRLIRLGLPLLFYSAVISPPMIAMLGRFSWGWNGTYGRILEHLYAHWWPPATGPLWFLEWALLLSVAYAVARALIPRGLSRPEPRTPASWWRMLSLAVALGGISFFVRLVYPVGRIWGPLNAQLAYHAQYVALFFVGTWIARGRGFEILSGGRPRVWGWLAVGLVLVFPVMFLLGQASSGSIDVFFGGWNWQTLAYAMWDQVLGISLILWLLAAFRKRLDRPTWFSRELAPSTYAAFVLHPPMVVGVGLMLRSVGLPPIPKFLVAGFVGLVVCFAAAGLVRRLPLVRRVVG